MCVYVGVCVLHTRVRMVYVYYKYVCVRKRDEGRGVEKREVERGSFQTPLVLVEGCVCNFIPQ